jgi:hypothetical protein
MWKRMGTMIVRTPLLLVCLFAVALCPVAQTVEVVVLQSSGQVGGRAARSSESIIDGALSALFEAGRIGTNVRPGEGGVAAFREFVPGASAKDAYIDYVLVIFAEYPSEALAPGVEALPLPSCRYRLVRVRDGQEVLGGEVPASVPSARVDTEFDKVCRSMGESIALACDAVLRRVSASWRNHEYSQA